MKKMYVLIVCFIGFACGKEGDDFNSNQLNSPIINDSSISCEDASYPDWQNSEYVLPYQVGTSYAIGLSHCSGSYHSFGQPDQYAIDFNMPIGTVITASRPGIVVFLEQSGEDFNFPNNKIVVKHSDGSYGQYMHLTKNGALIATGTTISAGDAIGISGATGLAGYPHLHFVVTESGEFDYPYTSIPMNFRNTVANPRSLEQGNTYEALSH